MSPQDDQTTHYIQTFKDWRERNLARFSLGETSKCNQVHLHVHVHVYHHLNLIPKTLIGIT